MAILHATPNTDTMIDWHLVEYAIWRAPYAMPVGLFHTPDHCFLLSFYATIQFYP